MRAGEAGQQRLDTCEREDAVRPAHGPESDRRAVATMNGAQEIRALLVEDDVEDAIIFARYVGKLGAYAVALERVRTIEDADRLLTTRAFDIVFLDMNLQAPFDGMELLKRMRGVGIKTPIVIVTGSDDQAVAVEAMKSGAYDYLVKDTLSPERIERAIRGVRQRHALEEERDTMMAKLARMIVTDDLTGVANRRRLMEKLAEEQERSARTRRPFALLMVDLDRFKKVNDSYGHQMGDRVLRECASVLACNVRAPDLVARYGGEEFCVVMPETAVQGARIAAERLRKAIEELPDPIPTVSIGVAVWRPGLNVDAILSRSDKALYKAKMAGRNCVVFGGESKPSAVGAAETESEAADASQP